MARLQETPNIQVSDYREADPRPKHRRNARGQGARLTGDIVSGALALIEREGSDEAVTLRAGSPRDRDRGPFDLCPLPGSSSHHDGRGRPGV